MSKPQAEVTCFFPQTWPPGKVTNGGLSWSGPENLQPQVTENGFIIDGAYDILADLHSRLVRLDCRIGVVESCTGGLLGSLLTSLAGSSAYFQGGWLTYSKEAKIQLAGVSPETLELYGAVSLETAEEMAQGGRGRLNLSHCLSITGIAGPGGATEEKPLGMVCFGLAIKDGHQSSVLTEMEVFSGNRQEIRMKSAYYALYLLHRELDKYAEQQE
jgi:nicotinamide-nucleotide amidase